MSNENNIHANLIAIDGKGVLIAGPSGSGKTLLALHLFRRCHRADIDVKWIADDQVLLHADERRLLGSSPESTRGRIEVRGFGIVAIPIPDVGEQEITLHVSLVSEEAIIRMWDGETIDLAGVQIDALMLCADQIEAAGNAIMAKLGHPIWV